MINKISLGQFNIFYIYIILYVNTLILNNFLFGQSYNDIFSEVKFFPSEIQKVFSTHYFFHQIIFCFFTCLLAILQSLYKKIFNTERKRSLSKFKLLYYDYEKEIKTKISFIDYILTVFIMIIEEQFLEKIFFYLFSYVDFWMIELVIITYINSKTFNSKIYKHHMLAIILNVTIPLTLKIITIIYSDKKIDSNKNYLMLIFGIIIYLIAIILRSLINSRIKYYMDLKYISEEKILILYGFLGGLLFLIYSIITSILHKKEDECLPHFDKTMFLENISQYFQIFGCKGFTKIELLKELLIIFIGSVCLFYKKYLFLLIIKYLTPVHIIFSYSIYNMFEKLLLMLNTLINLGRFFKTNELTLKTKFILDISGDIVSILCYVIYLEVIEFHCCKLDYNIKNNIIMRSIKDVNNLDETFSTELEEN